MAVPDKRINQFIEDRDTRVSVGIDFPFARVPNKDGYFKTTKTTVESIKINIKLLLQTQVGERVFQPNLGMSIKDFLFEQLTTDTTIMIENNIVDVFEKWLPYVELSNIEIKQNDNNSLEIRLAFSIQNTPTIETVSVSIDS